MSWKWFVVGDWLSRANVSTPGSLALSLTNLSSTGGPGRRNGDDIQVRDRENLTGLRVATARIHGPLEQIALPFIERRLQQRCQVGEDGLAPRVLVRREGLCTGPGLEEDEEVGAIDLLQHIEADDPGTVQTLRGQIIEHSAPALVSAGLNST